MAVFIDRNPQVFATKTGRQEANLPKFKHTEGCKRDRNNFQEIIGQCNLNY